METMTTSQQLFLAAQAMEDRGQAKHVYFDHGRDREGFDGAPGGTGCEVCAYGALGLVQEAFTKYSMSDGSIIMIASGMEMVRASPAGRAMEAAMDGVPDNFNVLHSKDEVVAAIRAAAVIEAAREMERRLPVVIEREVAYELR